jgi:hypothetical protein
MIDGEKIYNEIDWTPSVDYKAIEKIANKIAMTKKGKEPISFDKYTIRDINEQPMNINETRERIEKTKQELERLRKEERLETDKDKKQKISNRITDILNYNHDVYKLGRYIDFRPVKQYKMDFVYDSYKTDDIIKSLGDSSQEKKWKEFLKTTYDKVKTINEGAKSKIRNLTLKIALSETTNYAKVDWRINLGADDKRRGKATDYDTLIHSKFTSSDGKTTNTVDLATKLVLI